MLIVTATLPGCPSATLFDYSAVPEPLCRWWPPVAKVEPHVAGPAISPGWAWIGTCGATTDRGTCRTVTHGRYTASAGEQQERRGHLEGWTAFLIMLRRVAG